MFWAGLIVRVLYLTLARSYHFRTIQDHFQYGWEMGRIARALVLGHGYADPFVPGTGPTAWVPPLYPVLLAGVFKLFGIYTLASGWVVLTINSVFSAATAPAVYEIAARCYRNNARGTSIARWSGWLWALYPAAMQYAVRWVWEMSLTTMLFAWALVIALRIRGTGDLPDAKPKNTPQYWLIFGVLWGLIALSNPTLVLLFPICCIWLVFGAQDKAATAGRAMLAVMLLGASITFWTARNWLAFHAFVPMRGNLGAELYAGSGPNSNGFPWGATLPIVDRDPETQLYKTLGEVKFVKMRGDIAKAYIRTHRAHFALVSLKRFFFFWVSVPHPSEQHESLEYLREGSYFFLTLTGLFGLLLSLKRRIPAAGLFAWAFLLLPLTYYFVTPGARFRHPLEPLITVLSVYLFQAAEKTWRVRWFARI